MSKVIQALEQRQLRKDLPQFKAGDTVKVHFRVIEGSRSRIQVFKGVVIRRHGDRTALEVVATRGHVDIRTEFED